LTNRSFKNMPRTKDQNEEIRKNKSLIIRQAALELFASNGYMQTSISDIAKKAQISKGLLYNYFESKEELLTEIIKAGVNEFYSSFDTDKDGVLTGDEFEFFVRETFRLQNENREFYKLYYTLAMQPEVLKKVGELTAEQSARIFTTALNYFKKHFEKPETEMILFSSVIKGLSMQYLFAPEFFNQEKQTEIANRIIEMYKR